MRNLKSKYLLVIIFLFILISGFVFSSTFGQSNFELAKQELLFRKIGHEILLQSGDSTSRVLPIKKLADNEYLISFENEFTFQSDSLVNIIKRSLAKSGFSQDYIVNVLSCDGNSVQYGYAIFGSQKDDLIACSGRKQPKNCYQINVKFQNSWLSATQKSYLITSLPFLACIVFLLIGVLKNNKLKILRSRVKNPIQLGQIIFDIEGRQLIADETTVELTFKESKILLIFAQLPNVVVERSRLQKEIWEDEGVIVGRSLDVFISKLRKKLGIDSTLQLINIHGKGYKLEVLIS
jgi:DNA-binding winged helix-turn-helix (wHTH) protein